MGKGKGNNGGNRGARESGHKDDLDEIFSRGQKEKKGSRFRENNEDNELAAFSESLERFNPAQAIEKAGEEVTEAGSLALQETQELMPEGATPAQEAIVEGFDEQINAAQIDAQEALKRLNQERIEDEQRQQLSDQYLDAFADALRVEIQDKDMSSQEVVFDVYHRALGKARERVDISDELEIGLHSRIMKILEGIQDESSSGIDDEDYESSDKDQELDQPQAGINDFSALAGLRDKLPEKPEPPSNPESKLPYDKLNQEERKIRLVSFLRSFATTLQDAFEQKALVSDEQIRDVIIDSLHSVKNDSKLSMQAEKRLIRYLALIVQDIRNGENVSKLDFEDMIEQLPERTDEKSDKYIDYSPRERAFVDEIFDFSKTLVSNSDNHKKRQVTKSEQLPKSKNPFKAFEKVFADRLRLELRGMSSDTTEESLDATYRRVLDAVFENFNAELPKYETATLLGQKNSFDSNVDSGEGYGKRVKKISRDQARDIARRVNDQLKKEWRQKHEDVVGDLRRNLVDSEVGVEVGTVDTAEILDQVPTPQPEAPIIDVAPTVEGPEHIEARPAPTDIKIDPVKIKVGFTVVLGSGQSAQVTRTTAKTVFYQNPTDPNKEGKISINKIVAVKDEGGKVVMGEGAITESLADMGLEKESKALALRISELNDLCTGLIALNERAATDSGVQKLKQDVEKLLVVLSAPDISQGTIDSVAKKVDLFTTAIDGYQRRYSRGREPIQMDVGKEMAPEDSAAPDAPILSSEDIKELEDNTPLGDVENEDDMLVVEENSSNTEEVKKIVDIIEEAPVADAQIDEIITEIKDPGSLYGGFKSFQLFIDQLDPAVREKIDPDVIIVNRLHDRYCELEPQLSPLDDQVSEELKEEVISIGVQIQQARERIKATLGEAIDKTWPESSFPDSLEMPPLSNEEQEVLREVEEEFEKLTPEEQQKIALGFRNFGFKAKEWKGKKLASVWNKFANDTGTLGRFMKALGQTYERDAETARLQMEIAEQNKIDKNTTGRLKSGFFNTAIAFGGLTKIVRAGSELLGTTYFLPVRAGLMGAMAMTRLSEAGKEAHFSEKERQQREVEEQSIARDAQEISQELIGIAEVGPEKGNVNTSNDVINGIKNRLKKYGKSKSNQASPFEESSAASQLIQKALQWNSRRLVNSMRKEIIALRVKPVAQERTKEELKQYHEEIKIKKQQILRYYGRRIKDLDRMVDNFGVVDGTAALWQTGEVAGKVVVASLTVEMLLHTLTDIVEKTGAVDYVADSIWGGDVKAVPEAAPAVTPTPESAPVPVSTVTPETIPTTPAPIEATPAPSTSPVEDFTKDHLLYKETDAEITSVANGIKVEYQIGGEKGDFATLDQALRRVVAQEIDIGKGNELDATEATRAENVLANLRQLLEGKAVGVIKPAELDGIAQFKDGKLTILNYQKFDDFMDGKLFKRAIDNITEANIDTGYAQTSTEKWQEMLDKRGEKATIDFGSSTDAKASEVVESAASGATPTASPEAPSVATPVENLVSTEKNIDSNVIAETLGQQVLEPMDGGRPAVDLASRPLQEVTVNTASYPAEYMSDILSKMSPDQASALAEVMIEAKIDEKEWEGVNFIIEGNTDLLRNADGKFDPNQIELALELSKVQYPKPAELRLALEAMKVLNLEETQEAAIVKAITNPKEGPKALKDLFGDSIGNRGAKVTLNPRKGILHFENLGPQKLDGNMNFREGVLRIGKRAGAIFGGKFPLKNLVQAINSFK